MGNWPAPPQSLGIEDTKCTIRGFKASGFRVFGFVVLFGLKWGSLPVTPEDPPKMNLPNDSYNRAMLEDLGDFVVRSG